MGSSRQAKRRRLIECGMNYVPDSPPTSTVHLANRYGLGPRDASCLFCRALLRWADVRRFNLMFTNLVCSPGRTQRCVKAALHCRKFGPLQ